MLATLERRGACFFDEIMYSIYNGKVYNGYKEVVEKRLFFLFG